MPGRPHLPRWLRPAWLRWPTWLRLGKVRWWWYAILVPVVVAGLLLAADRVAAAYTENTIAARAEHYDFVGKPAVTVQGFPFLTQVMSGRLDGVTLSSGRVRLGAATASVTAHATGIALDARGGGDTIADITATGLISFPGVDKLTRAAGVPGATVSPAGPHLLTLHVSLPFIAATATASIATRGTDALGIHIISAPGVPAFLLQHFRQFEIHLPPLPLGLALRSVRVTHQGVIIAVTGHNARVGG